MDFGAASCGPPVDPKIDHPQAPKVDGIQIGEVGGESGLVFISGLTAIPLTHPSLSIINSGHGVSKD